MNAIQRIRAARTVEQYTFRFTVTENGRDGHVTFSVQAKSMPEAWTKIMRVPTKDLFQYVSKIELVGIK